MSSYQPGIPTGSVDLDVDYLNIQRNFQQLDTTFNVDHVTFSNQTAQNGYHKSVHLNPVSTAGTNPPNNYPPVVPPNTPGVGQVFCAQVNDGNTADSALYFLSGGNILSQLTSNFAPSASSNGYTYLPGGIIMQWAQFVAGGSTGTLAFNRVFPVSCFIVILQGDDNKAADANLLVTARTTANFSFKSLNSGHLYTYLAIGH